MKSYQSARPERASDRGSTHSAVLKVYTAPYFSPNVGRPFQGESAFNGLPRAEAPGLISLAAARPPTPQPWFNVAPFWAILSASSKERIDSRSRMVYG